MKAMLILLLVTVLTITTGIPAANEPPQVRLPLSFDHYYSYEMMVQALQLLHKAFPRLTKLQTVGKSEEGRDLYCLTLYNEKTGAELDKPGVYVDGNIHGNEIQATEVCLYLLDFLLHNYGRNSEVTQLVDKNVFYVVPTVNPDGRYHFFSDPNWSSSGRSIRIPRDDDNDGLADEDYPDDLDGDGSICRMRKRDPYGQYKTDPEDPRLMIRIKPGEKGEWTQLGLEGTDNDGDGRINEDAEGYFDGNRNWGFDWQPDYVQRGAGNYPFEATGLKGLAEFIRTRPNICIGWTFHNFGGMYLRGPSTKAQGEYPPQDVQVYNYLGEQAERITPGYRYMISWKDLYQTYGDSMEWLVMLNGAYGLVGELFQSETESFRTLKEKKKDQPATGEGGDEDESDMFGESNEFARQRLKFSDNLAQGELFVPWHPFKHPQYGDIEIGGWVKMSSRLPAPFMLKDLVHRNASAVIFSAKNTPEVKMEVFECKRIGDQLYRVRVRLVNAKAIPTMSYQAQKVKLYPQDMLTVSGANAKVTAGGLIQDLYQDKVMYKEYRPELQFLTIGGFGKAEYQFLVSGSGRIEIAYQSRHAGKIRKTVNLTE